MPPCVGHSAGFASTVGETLGSKRHFAARSGRSQRVQSVTWASCGRPALHNEWEVLVFLQSLVFCASMLACAPFETASTVQMARVPS